MQPILKLKVLDLFFLVYTSQATLGKGIAPYSIKDFLLNYRAYFNFLYILFMRSIVFGSNYLYLQVLLNLKEAKKKKVFLHPTLGKLKH